MSADEVWAWAIQRTAANLHVDLELAEELLRCVIQYERKMRDKERK